MSILKHQFKLLLIISIVASSTFASDVSITIDDFVLDEGPLLSAVQKDEHILESLEKHKIRIGLFVTAGALIRPAGKTRLAVWEKTSHFIANHTYSHIPYYQASFAEFSSDILKAHQILSKYKNFQKSFRFPQLKEGNTKEKRNEMREFLSSNGYTQGYVTIDASDWYINDRLVNRLKEIPKADISGFREFYLKHIWERAMFYDDLSQKVLGRKVKHTLLIHHNLLNALFLEDVLSMFKAKGWNLISAEEAFKDPVFKAQPNIVPAGESILWALAKETGKFENILRYPGEDGEYEKDKMNKLGL